METQKIVSWLRDKADRAEDPSWARMMKAAANKLVRYTALLNDERNCMTCEYSRDSDTRCMCQDSQWVGCRVNKDIYCGKYVKRQTVLTNADRIRAMSDKELAEFWSEHYDDFCLSKDECGQYINDGREIPTEWCAACTLAWLRKTEEDDP